MYSVDYLVHTINTILYTIYFRVHICSSTHCSTCYRCAYIFRLVRATRIQIVFITHSSNNTKKYEDHDFKVSTFATFSGHLSHRYSYPFDTQLQRFKWAKIMYQFYYIGNFYSKMVPSLIVDNTMVLIIFSSILRSTLHVIDVYTQLIQYALLEQIYHIFHSIATIQNR